MRNRREASALRRVVSFCAFLLSVCALVGTARAAGSELVANGDFEAGDASGWVLAGGGTFGCNADWNINPVGETGCLPLDGNASPAAYCALDGAGPKESTMRQTLRVPAGAYAGVLSLRFAARFSVGGAARHFRVDLYATDGALLQNAYVADFTGDGDSPWSAVSADVSATLSAHRGEDVVLQVSTAIPEVFTGPGGIGVDDISLLVDSYRVMDDGAAVAPGAPLSLRSEGKVGAETWTLETNASGGSVDAESGSYRAGRTSNVDDVVKVTDADGKVARGTIHVGDGVSILPAAPGVVPPRGSADFSASGGSGTGYVWSVTVNRSGGTVSAAGRYSAGSTAYVQDTLTVTDSLGNTRSVVVRVGPGVSITPNAPSVVPRASIPFAASGGSGEGFTWAMVTAPSGGRIDASTGVYLAGYVARVADVVMVTDSLGNTKSVSISVGGGLAISPPRIERLTGETVDFTATGGSGQGRIWGIATNASGATLDPATATYRAGFRAGTDTITLRDSIGNTAVAYVIVNARPPREPTVPPSAGSIPDAPREAPPAAAGPPEAPVPAVTTPIPAPPGDDGGCAVGRPRRGAPDGGTFALFGLTAAAIGTVLRRRRR